jgi:hypothetical protein
MKAAKSLKLTITSLRGQFKNRLCNENFAQNWGIELLEDDLASLYSKQDLVYLTGDATEDMEYFDKE